MNTAPLIAYPRIMTPEEELVFAVAALLRPDMFRDMDAGYGHVPKERAHALRRARKLVWLVRLWEGA